MCVAVCNKLCLKAKEMCRRPTPPPGASAGAVSSAGWGLGSGRDRNEKPHWQGSTLPVPRLNKQNLVEAQLGGGGGKDRWGERVACVWVLLFMGSTD